MTPWGQFKASILTDEAIEYGLSQLKFYEKASDPFKKFFDISKQYSIDNGLQVDWSRWYSDKLQYKMPENVSFVGKKEESIEKKDTVKYYSHKEIELDYNDECRKWHEMVVNWDKITDPKKKCAKGFELTYPGYTEWLKKQPLSTLLDEDLPDTLLYIDESKLTLLDVMRKNEINSKK